jgi:hypothetical protein
MAKKQQGGFGFGCFFYPSPEWSEKTAMTYHSGPIQINPDPRFLTIIVIGTAANVTAYIRDQHLRGYAKVYEWSKPQPAPNGSEKVLVALDRIMVDPPEQSD